MKTGTKKALDVYRRRQGTKKQYKEALQKGRCKSFLNQKLGTVTHKSATDYDRRREKKSLQQAIYESSND